MLTQETLGIYFSAILVVFVYSMFLYKDNPFFHIAENLALAVALANSTVISLKSLYDMAWVPGVVQGKDSVLWIGLLIFGGLIMTRLIPKYGWLSRWPTAFIVGSGVGLGLRGAIETQLLGNLRAVIIPVFGGKVTPIDNIVTLVMCTTTIAYFLFTREHKGVWGKVAKIGRYSMMVAFGAQFGSVTITRISSLGTRVIDILRALGLA